jgi:hypothetical protein
MMAIVTRALAPVTSSAASRPTVLITPLMAGDASRRRRRCVVADNYRMRWDDAARPARLRLDGLHANGP